MGKRKGTGVTENAKQTAVHQMAGLEPRGTSSVYPPVASNRSPPQLPEHCLPLAAVPAQAGSQPTLTTSLLQKPCGHPSLSKRHSALPGAGQQGWRAACWGAPCMPTQPQLLGTPRKGHHIHPQHLKRTLRQCLQAPCLWPRSVAFIYYISLKEEVALNPPKCLCACS